MKKNSTEKILKMKLENSVKNGKPVTLTWEFTIEILEKLTGKKAIF